MFQIHKINMSVQSSSDDKVENEVNVNGQPCADLDGPPCAECDQRRMEIWQIIHWAWGVLENMPANLVSICRYTINMFLTLYISQHVRWACKTGVEDGSLDACFLATSPGLE